MVGSDLVSYRPSVCYQTADEHIHYNFILIKSTGNYMVDLSRLASKLGVRTAGDVVTIIQDRVANGELLSHFGISFIKIEHLPTYQICHKGEQDSPSIDWNAIIYGLYPLT